MKESLYLTEYKLNKSQSLPKLGEKAISRNSFNQNLQKDNTYFLSKTKGFGKLKESMLDYMIQEETGFLNLDNCESFYKNKNMLNKKEVNDLLIEKKKKLEYLENIEKQIQSVLIEII